MSDTRPQNSKTARDGMPAQAAVSAAEAGAEAAERNSRAAVEAMRQSGETVTIVAHRAAETGAETLRRGTEAVAETQRQMSQDAAERLQDVTRTLAEMARGTAEDVRALMSLPTVADRGLREFHDGLTSLVDGVVRTNLRATEEFFRVTTPAGFVEVQQRFMRDYLNVVMEGSAALVRAIRQTADQALPPLEQHLRQRRHAQGIQGKSYQTAAE